MRLIALLLTILSLTYITASRNEISSLLSIIEDSHHSMSHLSSVISSEKFTTTELSHLEIIHSFTLSTGGIHGDIMSHPFRSSSIHDVKTNALHASKKVHGMELPHGTALHIQFQALGQEFSYHLQPMYHLMTSDSMMTTTDAQGVEHKEAMKLQTYFMHEGDEWVSLTVHQEGTFSAIIRRNDETYQVDPTHVHYEAMESEHHWNTLSSKATHGMTIFRHSDVMAEGNIIGGKVHACAAINKEGTQAAARGEQVQSHQVHVHQGAGARRLLDTIVPFNCGQQVGASGYAAVSMGQVVDYGMFLRAGNPTATAAGASAQKVTDYVQSVYMQMNSVYMPQFKMVLQLKDIQIEQTTDQANGKTWNIRPAVNGKRCDITAAQGGGALTPAGATYTIPNFQTTLEAFAAYVQTAKPNSNTLWHHMTNCFPPGGVIGIAYVGTMCSRLRSGCSTFSSTTWLTMAHEIGHNFGADHTFQLGQGLTGGIMDYGNGKLIGGTEYQFNIIYSKTDICGGINGIAADPTGVRRTQGGVKPFCYAPLAALDTPAPGVTLPPVATQAPPATVRPTPPVTPGQQTYTAAQVATHNTAGNCWCIIGTGVYDITRWNVAGKHPGGAIITQSCGKDATQVFNQNHRNAATYLTTKIGTDRIGALGVATQAPVVTQPPPITPATQPPVPTQPAATPPPNRPTRAPGDVTIYKWAATPFGTCSANCEGTQTRQVVCVNANNLGNLIVVPDQKCIDYALTVKAVSVQACGGPCPVKYVVDNTKPGNCTSSTGATCAIATPPATVSTAQGTLVRSFLCYKTQNGKDILVADAVCAIANVQKPTTGAQTCTLPTCPGRVTWAFTSWSACTAPCNGGQQTRRVACIFVDNVGGVKVTGDNDCANAGVKPISVQNCNTQPCVTAGTRYVWTITSEFGPCTAPCNGGMQTRTAFCTDTQTNQVIPGFQCPNMPILQQPCNTQACGVYVWTTERSGPCNATCGPDAYLTRVVKCVNSNNQYGPSVDPTLCLQSEKPASVLPCVVAACPITPGTIPVTPAPGTPTVNIPVNPPAPLPPTPPATTSLTLSQVATHKDVTNCYVVISGLVYDISGYASSHPGGAAVIASACGTDATDTVIKMHTPETKQPDNVIRITSHLLKVNPTTQLPYAKVIGPVNTGIAAYTLSEVAKHGAPNDCWIVFQGKVYDMSGYGEATDPHPGGAAVLYAQCGKDATSTIAQTGIDHDPTDAAFTSRLKGTVQTTTTTVTTAFPPDIGTRSYAWYIDTVGIQCGGPAPTPVDQCLVQFVSDAKCVLLNAAGTAFTDCPREYCQAADGTYKQPNPLTDPRQPRKGQPCPANDPNPCARRLPPKSLAKGGYHVLSAAGIATAQHLHPLQRRTIHIMADAATSGPQWLPGPFTQCTVLCGGGNQVRNVTCIDASTGVQLADSQCDARIKPEDSVSCGIQKCSAFWAPGPWNDCSESCGGTGNQSRIVNCRRSDSPDGLGQIIDDADCLLTAPKPSTTQSCGVQPCPKWVGSVWGECSIPCGPGSQKLTDARCVDHYGNTISDDECIKSSQYNAIRPCNMGPCPVYDHGEWEPCSRTCALPGLVGTQNRTVLCRTPSAGDVGGAEQDMKICDQYDGDGRAKGNHVTQQECNVQPCGDLYWEITNRQACDKACGGGTRRVTSVCKRKAAGATEYTTVSDDECLSNTMIAKPIAVENCNNQPCSLQYGWSPSEWGPCSSFCGNGNQTRDVTCIDLISRVAAKGLCAPNTQFATSRTCYEPVEKCFGDVPKGGLKNGACITDAANPKQGTCQCRLGYGGQNCTAIPSINNVYFENSKYTTGVPVFADERIVIRWVSSGAAQDVSILLMRDDPTQFFAQYIARQVIDTGVYTWNVGATLKDLPFADKYILRVASKNKVYGQTETFSTAPACSYKACGSNAICDSGECKCQSGYTGPNCQITPCQRLGCDEQRSTCDNTQAEKAQCMCKDGWTGPQCRTPLSCTPRCQNGGDYFQPIDMPIINPLTCPMDDDDVSCTCRGSFTGTLCDKCGLTCDNGGVPDATCTKCICKAGWIGKSCGCRYYDIKAKLDYDTSAWTKNEVTYTKSTTRFQQTFANDMAAGIVGLNANQIEFNSMTPNGNQVDIAFKLTEMCSSISQDLLMNDMIRIDGVHIAYAIDLTSGTMSDVYSQVLKQLKDTDSQILNGFLASKIVPGSVQVTDPLGTDNPTQPGTPSDKFGSSDVPLGVYAPSSSSGISGMVIGIIVGAVVVTILAIVAIVYCVKQRQQSTTRTLNKVTTDQMPQGTTSQSTTPRSTAFVDPAVLPMQQRVQHVYGAGAEGQ